MESKVMQVAVVVLAVVMSSQACTPCTRRCPAGTECRLLELCFVGCELFPICSRIGQAPSSSVCPGNDPIVTIRRNLLRCNLTQPQGSRCPGDSVCTPSFPGALTGLCCPCGSAAAPAPQARLQSSLQSFNAVQEADAPAVTSPAPTAPTTRGVRCPFFASACGGRK